MTNLLSADRMRVQKSWFFWVALLIAAAVTVPPFREELSVAGRIGDPSEGWVIDDVVFQSIMIHGMILAVFVPPFLGADFHDGTIRNKLIAGHRRSGIYGSAFCTCLLTALCLTAVSAAGTALQAAATHGLIGMDAERFTRYVLACLCCAMAFVSLYVMISMLIPERSYAIIACIVVLFAMLMLSAFLEHVLLQAETARDMLGLVDGQPVWGEEYPNPAYVGGFRRQVYEWIVDFFPTGQGSHLSNLEAERVSSPVR